jgi:hypothetical protein
LVSVEESPNSFLGCSIWGTGLRMSLTVLSANGVFRRLWSLHFKWKNPSRHGWGEVQ